jgi:hypothetical protein
MSESHVLKVGVVGFGAAAQAFLPSFTQHPGFELVSVCDPNEEVQHQVQSLPREGIWMWSTLHLQQICTWSMRCRPLPMDETCL